MSSVDRRIGVDLDTDENAAVAVGEERREVEMGELFDSGIRVSETIALDVDDHLDLDDGVIALPADLQKDYPTDRSPSDTEIELADETVRTLRMYLAGRWKDSTALWPSRQSDRMSTESVRNRLRNASIQTTERVYDHIDRV